MRYVGWQATIVRKRKTALADRTKARWWLDTNDRDKTIPLVRRWLGDRPVYLLVYEYGTTADDIRRLQRLFPEALFRCDRDFDGMTAAQP